MAAGGFQTPRRIPVFVGAQAQCRQCGREVRDPLALEEWAPYCSARCHYGAGLPALREGGA